mmetsp:Transcript_89773/g.199481  ORF Transcript_89773/g.199481 Transcript_89773/m.199481 type:complete len:356 (+) Transcript_89773:287-1354(+)
MWSSTFWLMASASFAARSCSSRWAGRARRAATSASAAARALAAPRRSSSHSVVRCRRSHLRPSTSPWSLGTASVALGERPADAAAAVSQTSRVRRRCSSRAVFVRRSSASLAVNRAATSCFNLDSSSARWHCASSRLQASRWRISASSTPASSEVTRSHCSFNFRNAVASSACKRTFSSARRSRCRLKCLRLAGVRPVGGSSKGGRTLPSPSGGGAAGSGKALGDAAGVPGLAVGGPEGELAAKGTAPELPRAAPWEMLSEVSEADDGEPWASPGSAAETLTPARCKVEDLQLGATNTDWDRPPLASCSSGGDARPPRSPFPFPALPKVWLLRRIDGARSQQQRRARSTLLLGQT